MAVDFVMGGLNYQVEHHLFPSMPRPNLKHVQPVVRDYCEQLGVKYTEVGFFRSYKIIVDVPQPRRPGRPGRVRLPCRRHVRALTGYTQERTCSVSATAGPSWSTNAVERSAATSAGTCSSTAGSRP